MKTNKKGEKMTKKRPLQEIVLALNLAQQRKAKAHRERKEEIAKGNSETFTWADINTALVKTGNTPKQILNILVNLNQLKKERI
tara:strand:+ start:287 stop:538 length:252 start_codon:yes stop_codon:yes gene_type:complete